MHFKFVLGLVRLRVVTFAIPQQCRNIRYTLHPLCLLWQMHHGQGEAERKLACNFAFEDRFLTTNASALAPQHLPADFMLFPRICVLNPLPPFSSLQRAIYYQTGAVLHPSARNVG